MISVEEARERILSYFDALESEEREITEALGQALTDDVVASFDIPPLDNTSMDGYAVRATDTSGATDDAPVRLRVIGELAAGYVFDGEIREGEAVRIMTGAPVPRGADAIVPFEETDEPPGRGFGQFAKSRDHVGVRKPAAPGNNVRRAGEDVRRGLPELGRAPPARVARGGLGRAALCRKDRERGLRSVPSDQEVRLVLVHRVGAPREDVAAGPDRGRDDLASDLDPHLLRQLPAQGRQ